MVLFVEYLNKWLLKSQYTVNKMNCFGFKDDAFLVEFL